MNASNAKNKTDTKANAKSDTASKSEADTEAKEEMSEETATKNGGTASESKNGSVETSSNTPSKTSGGESLTNRIRRVYKSRPQVDFPKIWPKTILISIVFLLIAGGAWGLRGLNLGIEFEGGVVWELSSDDTSVSELRDVIRPFGQGDARIQSISGDLYRIRAEVEIEDTSQVIEIRDALAESVGQDPNEVSYSAIGPSWGEEITDRARLALIVFFCVIAVYIWLRLEWRMTFAALVAVGHDIVITVGIYALFQLEVTPATLIAFLTILGYSLYDTLVVFDKVRENEASRTTLTQMEVVSVSMNQVLVRSVNTTITSVLPVLTLLIVGRYFLGAVTLAEFSVALLIGILAGTYSSIFVATPLIAWLKGREESKVKLAEKGDGKGEGKSADSETLHQMGGHRAKKGMLAQSRVVTTPQTVPRPQKKRRKK